MQETSLWILFVMSIILIASLILLFVFSGKEKRNKKKNTFNRLYGPKVYDSHSQRKKRFKLRDLFNIKLRRDFL